MQIENGQGEANKISFLLKPPGASWLAEIRPIYIVFYLVIASYST